MGGRVVNSALARPNDFSAAAIIDVSDSASAHCGVRLHCDEIWPSRWRMDRLLVASPVPARRNLSIDLVKQIRCFRDGASIVQRQFHRPCCTDRLGGVLGWIAKRTIPPPS